MILDLFSGPGGWDEGMRSLGITDVVGLEWDAAACRTRAAAGHQTIRCDVAAYPVEPFVGRVRKLAGSPPCQALSAAGKQLGKVDLPRIHAGVELCRSGWTDAALAGPWKDPRSPLILQPLRWAWALREGLEWIALEQVPPALGVWEHMADVLRAWGFSATAVVLSAEQYGVPQTRSRALLLAHADRVQVPAPTHQRYEAGVPAGAAPDCAPSLLGPGLRPWVSMAEALGWVGALDRRNTQRAVDGGREAVALVPTNRPAPSVTGAPGQWVLRAVAERNGAQKNATERGADEPAPTLTASMDNGDSRWQLRQNNRPHGADSSVGSPAPTLHFGQRLNDVRWVHHRPATTVAADASIGRPGHKDRAGGEAQFQEDSVRVEVREAAVLQGFRPDYPWQGTRTQQYQQVGNAVPPPLAAAIVGALEGVDAGAREVSDAA